MEDFEMKISSQSGGIEKPSSGNGGADDYPVLNGGEATGETLPELQPVMTEAEREMESNGKVAHVSSGNGKVFTEIGTSLHCELDGVGYAINYFEADRRGGFKATIQVKTQNGIIVHADTVPLLSDRARKNFAERCRKYFAGADVEGHLLKLNEHLTMWAASVIEETSKQPQEMTESERAEALEFLRAPNIFERIKNDITTLGIVGDDNLKLMLYVICTSRLAGKLPGDPGRPIHCYVIGESSVGKSYQALKIAKMMPSESLIEFSSLSAKALIYLSAEYSFKNKILLLYEIEGGKGAEFQLRIAMSEDKLCHFVTVRNPQTGLRETKCFEQEGPMAFIQTGTKIDINPENRTRFLEISPDHSKAQTKRIHEIQKYLRTAEGIKTTASYSQIIRIHQNAQRLLQPYQVVIPYSMELTFPAPENTLRARRDISKLLNIINAVALLRQFQKPVKYFNDGNPFIEADVEDYRITYELSYDIFRDALAGINPKSRELLRIIIANKKGEDGFSRTEIAGWCGWPESTLRKFLYPLEVGGYLVKSKTCSRGRSVVYEGHIGVPSEANDLLTPEELAQKLKLNQ